MEFAKLLLLILLPSADAGTDMTAAIQAALYQDLGQVAIAVAPDTPSSRKSWQNPQGAFKARYVARFDWVAKRKARIELWRGDQVGKAKNRIGMREVSFAATDATAEQGRAIGLVIVQLMRELPDSDLFPPAPAAVAAAPVPPPAPPANFFVGRFNVEHARSGGWTYGPEVLALIRLSPRLCAQGNVFVGMDGDEGYTEVGFGAGVAYFPLQSTDLRHGLGVGLRLGAFREWVREGEEDEVSTKIHWAPTVAGEVTGYVGIWRSLQAHAAMGLRGSTGELSFTVGEDSSRRTYTYGSWRPAFSVGLGFAF